MEAGATIRRQKNSWTTHEVALVERHYPTTMPLAQLAALLPRHTEYSIQECGRKMLGLRRPSLPRKQPAWERMYVALKIRPMTQAELAEAMGFSNKRASELLMLHRAEVRICGWRWPEDLRSPSQIWGLGPGPDVPRPMGAQRARHHSVRRADPFSALVAQVAA